MKFNSSSICFCVITSLRGIRKGKVALHIGWTQTEWVPLGLFAHKHWNRLLRFFGERWEPILRGSLTLLSTITIKVGIVGHGYGLPSNSYDLTIILLWTFIVHELVLAWNFSWSPVLFLSLVLTILERYPPHCCIDFLKKMLGWLDFGYDMNWVHNNSNGPPSFVKN